MFDWKPQYSVNIPAIDAQHQRLFALASELHVAMAQGKGKAILEHALARLVDYTKEHFAAEEALMKKYQFPEADGHKLQHDRLAAQVLEFQTKFRREEIGLTSELLLFLKDWLEKHINGSDQKYAAHVRGKMAA